MYETTHLALCAYLLYQGHTVESSRKHADRNQTIFSFPKTAELMADANTYYKNSAVVEPQKYFNAVKDLKSLIYAANN